MPCHAARDADKADQDLPYALLSVQPGVFSRLTGFLAAGESRPRYHPKN